MVLVPFQLFYRYLLWMKPAVVIQILRRFGFVRYALYWYVSQPKPVVESDDAGADQKEANSDFVVESEGGRVNLWSLLSPDLFTNSLENTSWKS